MLQKSEAYAEKAGHHLRCLEYSKPLGLELVEGQLPMEDLAVPVVPAQGSMGWR